MIDWEKIIATFIGMVVFIILLLFAKKQFFG